MARHTSRNIALLAMTLASGVALANPEAGGNVSQKLAALPITSTNGGTPTILTSVVVRCPAAGFLIANADASFELTFLPGSTSGTVAFGISRDVRVFDLNDSHSLQTSDPGVFPGSIQRFDSCAAGQSVTHRFVAVLLDGLDPTTSAFEPRLSAIFLRDRD